MSAPLSGKTVLVTGASAGIGRATAVALAQAGAKIIATGRRKIELDALAKQCGGAAVETVAGDLNDRSFVDELAKRADGVDIMAHNAGVLKYAPLMAMTEADCEAMFRTNVLASFRVILAVARSMVARRRGHIIVMSSIAAREVYRLGVIYCTTKHALSAFARGLRIELQGERHQGHRDRTRDGRYRHPRHQRPPERGGGRESQKVRGAHVGGGGGGGRLCGDRHAELLPGSHRAAAARIGVA